MYFGKGEGQYLHDDIKTTVKRRLIILNLFTHKRKIGSKKDQLHILQRMINNPLEFDRDILVFLCQKRKLINDNQCRMG